MRGLGISKRNELSLIPADGRRRKGFLYGIPHDLGPSNFLSFNLELENQEDRLSGLPVFGRQLDFSCLSGIAEVSGELRL